MHPKFPTGGPRWLATPQARPFGKTIEGVRGRSARQGTLEAPRSRLSRAPGCQPRVHCHHASHTRAWVAEIPEEPSHGTAPGRQTDTLTLTRVTHSLPCSGRRGRGGHPVGTKHTVKPPQELGCPRCKADPVPVASAHTCRRQNLCRRMCELVRTPDRPSVNAGTATTLLPDESRTPILAFKMDYLP